MPEVKGSEKSSESIFEIIMAKNFAKLYRHKTTNTECSENTMQGKRKQTIYSVIYLNCRKPKIRRKS